ncbi:NusG domain II-containing protein [Paenibacillus physcomitrellae]|uniref:Lipoprotein n=1 Tax=Paenibacillus physcomitrellae TaxID=1619311 RepID=A0ABQ1GKB2_9BACL|nr:NusG domain II-containing protein [Paenibacillus physcomitrellae]GGA45515.1 lipoprotein [Paenibacillus physcomitrellae]
MLKIRKADWLLIAIVLLAVAGYFGGKALFERADAYAAGKLEARITVNGELYKQVPLTQEEQVIDMRTKYGHNVLKVYDNGIRMTVSDAPLPIALKMGFISKPGERIICVPNRVLVEIVSAGSEQPGSETDPLKDGLDAVVN